MTAVEDLAWTQLTDSDAALIKLACQQTVYSALKENEAGRLDRLDLNCLEEKIEEVHDLMAQIPIKPGDEGGLPPGIQLETQCARSDFEKNHHILSTGEDR